MKSAYRFLTVLTVLLSPSIFAQESPEMPELDYDEVVQEFGGIVSKLSNQNELSAQDHYDFAQSTLKLAMASQQSSKEIPETAIHDALEATRTGRELDSTLAPWDRIEEILLQLLEEPPEQEQEQQEGDNSEQQEEQDGEQEEGQDGQEEGQEGDQQDSEQQDGDESQQGQEGEEEQQGEQQPGDESEGSEESSQQGENQSLGDMQEPEGDVSLDEDSAQSEEERQAQEEAEQRAQEQNMQQIGGSQGEEQEATSTQQAIALQQLDKIQENDDPGKLHMLLQQAEGDENQSDATPNKDW